TSMLNASAKSLRVGAVQLAARSLSTSPMRTLRSKYGISPGPSSDLLRIAFRACVTLAVAAPLSCAMAPLASCVAALCGAGINGGGMNIGGRKTVDVGSVNAGLTADAGGAETVTGAGGVAVTAGGGGSTVIPPRTPPSVPVG